MQTKHTLPLLAGCLLAASALGVAAQGADERGWYGGVAVGGAKVKINNNIFPVVGAAAHTFTKDDRAGTGSLLVGYDFTRHWAMEAGYTGIGDFSARRNVTAPAAGSLGGTIDMDAWFLQGLGKVPLDNNFHFFGKLGIARSTTKSSFDRTGAVVIAAGTNLAPERSESNGLWGIGFGYEASRNLTWRLDYTRLHKVGDANTGEGDVNLLTIGVKVRFK